MKDNRILYVCQEIMPYLNETRMSHLCRTLPQAVQEKGLEIRTFMPRYGSVNERRNQLHEVIRLSGMNLIIDDNDHQLIIKVASIPSARVQIYFIDNEEYFRRKEIVYDDNGVMLPDNDERAIFFARGVLETVKKLRWSPNIVHCNGWFTSIVPAFLKRMFADDPIFANVKVVITLFDDEFTESLDKNITQKLQNIGLDISELTELKDPTYVNLMKFVLQYTDGIVYVGNNINEELMRYIESSGKPVLKCQDENENYTDQYIKFYDKVLES